MRVLFLGLCALLSLSATLDAQTGPLTIRAGGEDATVPLAMHRGHAAYPATALRTLGAVIHADEDGARVTLFGDTLAFQANSPFFTAAGEVRQLASPIYREGGILYLPHQFFAEWLPARYPRHIVFRDGVLRYEAASDRDAVATREGRASGGAGEGTSSAAPAGGRAEDGARATGEARPARVVILDPGHGGRDPGKTGPNGVREKDVVLAIARRLAEVLERRGGYEVHLTRTADTLIALADRPRLANQWKAGRPSALFVSIHANAHHTQARGFETFFLSEARTEDERRVAEMENAAVAYEDRPGPASADDLDWILNNLRNDFYLRASHDLAAVIQNRLQPVHPGPNRGVKQAGFRVLVGAFMPAVLVETAFITHREEERLLGSAAFQRRLAETLADAIDEFFEEHEHLWITASS